MGHFKVTATKPEPVEGTPYFDPAQGYDVYVSFVDDEGKEHPVPATAVDIKLRPGREVALCQITTGAFEMDLPNTVVDLIRDPDAKLTDTFDANRRGVVISEEAAT